MQIDRLTVCSTAVAEHLRRLPRSCVMAICALLVCSQMISPATAQLMLPQVSVKKNTSLNPELVAKLSRRGDLTLRNTSLPDALFTISELWKVNLVVGEEVQGQVNGAFQEAPLHDILDAILLSGGYSYRPVGQSLVIMKIAELGDVNPLYETATVPVVGADPKDVLEGARLFSSPLGKVQAITSAKSLLVVDYPDRVAMIRTFVAELNRGHSTQLPQGRDDDQIRVAYFAPQYVPALSLKEALATVLSKEGKLAVMETENRVVMFDYPPNLRLGKEVIERVDVPRPQVRIAAYIYDISLQDMERLGVNWSHALQSTPDSDGNVDSLFGIDAVTSIPFQANAVGGAMTLMNMSRNFNLTAVVNMLNTADDSRLLADPNVVVVDNEPATISIISEIPFQQLTQTGQGGNIGTTAFREAGVKLTVTPRIASDGTVLLNVTPEFSRLVGTSEDGQPVIDRRTAQTVVRVANQQTLVIGGLRQRSDLGNFDGIPLLKDIPYLGFIFRSRETQVKESELVVFLRPEIITPHQPLDHREGAAMGATRAYLDQIPVGEQCDVLPEQIVYPEEVPAEVPQPSQGDRSRESSDLARHLPRSSTRQAQYQSPRFTEDRNRHLATRRQLPNRPTGQTAAVTRLPVTTTVRLPAIEVQKAAYANSIPAPQSVKRKTTSRNRPRTASAKARRRPSKRAEPRATKEDSKHWINNIFRF